MNSIRTSAAALALLIGAGFACAADLSTKDSPASANPFSSAFNWAGFYIEGGASASFAESDIAHAFNLASNGWRFDGRIGYDVKAWSVGNNSILAGVYGGIGNNFDVNTSIGKVTLGQRWNEDIGLKMAYAYDTGQLYGLCGYTHQNVSLAGWNPGLDGWECGGGVKMKVFWPHSYLSLEAMRKEYDTATAPKNLGSLPLKEHDWTVGPRIGFDF